MITNKDDSENSVDFPKIIYSSYKNNHTFEFNFDLQRPKSSAKHC